MFNCSTNRVLQVAGPVARSPACSASRVRPPSLWTLQEERMTKGFVGNMVAMEERKTKGAVFEEEHKKHSHQLTRQARISRREKHKQHTMEKHQGNGH
jgi:hypothetical protein